MSDAIALLHKAMSLRTKTLLIIGASMLLVTSLLAAVLALLLDRSYHALEQQTMIDRVQQARNALDNTRDELASTARDYAIWDDAYAFAADGNQGFIATHFAADTFATNQLSLVVITNQQGEPVFQQGYDLATDTLQPVPPEFHSASSTLRRLLRKETDAPLNGVLRLSSGAILLAAHPVLTSAGTGPTRGTLIMGRALDAYEMQQLAALTRLPLAVQPLAASAGAALPDDTPRIEVLDDERVAGYGLVRDIFDQPALELRVESPRLIHAMGHTAINSMLLALGVTALVSCGLALLLVERVVLARLIGLSQAVGQIAQRGDVAGRVVPHGRDEIAALAGTINQMLSSLEQMQLSLAESKETAEQASAAKSRFLATVSHELRTPLTTILGFSELIVLRTAQTDPELAGDVERIRRAALHLLALINDILDTARLEAGHLQLDYRLVAPATIISEVLAALRPAAEQHHNQLSADLDALPALMLADPVRLQQILLNLVGNACKFTSHGRITVTTSMPDATHVVFCVSDTGIGLSEEQIASLFVEFQQTEAGRQRGGSGLGLALSRRLSRQMGGDISVSSTLGRGSCFSLILPLQPPNAEPDAATAPLVADRAPAIQLQVA